MESKIKDCVIEKRDVKKKTRHLDGIQYLFVNLKPVTKFYFQRTYFAHIN